MKIHLDPEFGNLLPNDDEPALDAQIVADGKVLIPQVVWKCNGKMVLLDGYRRERIASRHGLGLPKPIVLDFESRQEAFNWVIDQQATRRNLTEEKKRYLIGKRYQLAKQPVGKPNSESVSELKAPDLAEKEGVTARTLQNAGDFAEAVDSVPKEVKDAVLSGAVAGTTKDLESLAELPKAKQKKAAKKIASGEVKSVKKAMEAVSDDEPKAEEELTFEEEIAEENKLIESFCRELVKFYENNVPNITWTADSGRIDSALSNIKAACATLRSAKAVVCPACTEGQNKKGKCGYCKGHGYLPAHVEKTIPDSMRL